MLFKYLLPQPLIGELTSVKLEGHDWLGSDILRYAAIVHSGPLQEFGRTMYEFVSILRIISFCTLMLIAEQLCNIIGGINR